MKTIFKGLCLVLLLSTLWVPALGAESRDASASVVRTSRDGSVEQAPAVTPEDAGRRIRFGRISTDQGPSGNEVWSIAQDRQGFMWFGTSNGLNRYDGYDFKVFKHNPDDPHSPSENLIKRVNRKNNISTQQLEISRKHIYNLEDNEAVELFGTIVSIPEKNPIYQSCPNCSKKVKKID